MFYPDSYLDVLLDLVSALLMTSEGADCRLWANVFIFWKQRRDTVSLRETLESHLWTRCPQRQQLGVVVLTCVPENTDRRGNKV